VRENSAGADCDAARGPRTDLVQFDNGQVRRLESFQLLFARCDGERLSHSRRQGSNASSEPQAAACSGRVFVRPGRAMVENPDAVVVAR